MPRESPDAPEDLPKDAPGQVTFGQLTFGQLEDEVPSVPNEASADLEQPLAEILDDVPQTLTRNAARTG